MPGCYGDSTAPGPKRASSQEAGVISQCLSLRVNVDFIME